MNKFCSIIYFVIVSAFGSSILNAEVNQSTKELVKQNLVKLGLNLEDIKDSKIDGLLEVYTERGLFYFSESGRYLLHGKAYDLSEGVLNITEESLAGVRIKGSQKFKSSAITFAAKKQKYQVTVFTDTSCGYCRKLHSQIDAYNDLGITVNYLAFPRSGVSGPTFREMKSIWCAEDAHQAMTNAKNGDRSPPKQKASCSAPIAEQYSLGLKVGVSGTPAIVFEDGSMIPGYQDPEQLLSSLKAKE